MPYSTKPPDGTALHITTPTLTSGFVAALTLRWCSNNVVLVFVLHGRPSSLMLQQQQGVSGATDVVVLVIDWLTDTGWLVGWLADLTDSLIV